MYIYLYIYNYIFTAPLYHIVRSVAVYVDAVYKLKRSKCLL